MRGSPPPDLLFAGYFVGHPATGPDLGRCGPLGAVLRELAARERCHGRRVFTDLAAARQVACDAPGAQAPHGLWLERPVAEQILAEDQDAAVAPLLRAGPGRAAEAPVAAGYDVLGIGGALILAWTSEDAGRRFGRSLGLQLEPVPFLPDGDAADELVALLDAEDLGAPVLWTRCWRTVHAMDA